MTAEIGIIMQLPIRQSGLWCCYRDGLPFQMHTSYGKPAWFVTPSKCCHKALLPQHVHSLNPNTQPEFPGGTLSHRAKQPELVRLCELPLHVPLPEKVGRLHPALLR